MIDPTFITPEIEEQFIKRVLIPSFSEGSDLEEREAWMYQHGKDKWTPHVLSDLILMHEEIMTEEDAIFCAEKLRRDIVAEKAMYERGTGKFSASTESDTGRGSALKYLSNPVRQFKKPYIKGVAPNTCSLLLERIKIIFGDTGDLFAPWLNILQSSGTGKTRAIFELAREKKTSLFYICHREAGDGGFPNATPGIFNFLHSEPVRYDDSNDAVDPDLRLYCRFVGFFFYVWLMDSRRGSDLAGQFEDGFLFDSGAWDVRTMGEYENELYRRMQSADNGALQVAKAGRRTTEVNTLTVEEREGIAQKWIMGKKATRSYADHKPVGDAKFIVLVDECRSFQAFPNPTRLRFDMLMQLGRASRVVWHQGGLLVSADSFHQVIPLQPRIMFSSARVVPEGTKQMIFTHVFGWDLEYKQAKTVAAAVCDAHVLTTGRPLWTAQLVTMVTYQTVFDFIHKKLLCGTWVGASATNQGGVSPAAQCAAVLCARVGLDPHPYTKLSTELVGSHLALLELFDHATGRCVVSYPSDAALARAARMEWRNETRLVSAIERVSDLMHTREIEHGERSEVAAQILILNVLDKLTCKKPIVTVKEFLGELFTPRGNYQLQHHTGRMVIPRYTSLDSLLRDVTTPHNQAVLGGVLNVEQFCKIHYHCSVEDLCAYFSRGMGVIARVDEKAYDLYLPVVLESANAVGAGAQSTVLEDLLAPVSGEKASAGRKGAAVAMTEEEAEVMMEIQVVSTKLQKAMRDAEKRKVHDRTATLAVATATEPPSAVDEDKMRNRPILPQHMTVVAITVKCSTGKALYNYQDNGTRDRIRGLGSSTPYAALGLYFSDLDAPVLHPLQRTSKAAKDAQCLCLATNNAHLLRTSPMADALHTLRTGQADPLKMLPATATEAERLAQMTLPGIWRYATKRNVGNPTSSC